MISRALVVGLGSIGSRHLRILRELGIRTAVVSRHHEEAKELYRDLPSALGSFRPDYVVVANATAEHGETLRLLESQGYCGPVLVEKPLFSELQSMWSRPFAELRVAYNLRFHPALRELFRRIEGERIICVQAYVGQFLPTWRPSKDYRDTYSARKADGGGALRDLSHELDFLQWLFGGWVRLTSIGGRFGDLEIDSDDCWLIMMQTIRGTAVTVQLNYLDRTTRREMLVVGARHSYRVDLVSSVLEVDGVVEHFEVDRDHTYRAQHLAAISDRWDELCSFEQGIHVMETISAVERAAESEEWVTR